MTDTLVPLIPITFHGRTAPPRTADAPYIIPVVLELKIITKDRRFRRIGDVIKADQWDFLCRCQQQLNSRGQIRVIVLKARQIGISTIIEAIIFSLSMILSSLKSLIISHEDKSSTHILGMTRLYWKTYVFNRYYHTIYNGKNHLSWDNDADIHIATAKNVDAGRSTTLHALHASEVAFWPDPDTLMTGLMNAIPSFGLNIIFLESTANGVGNYFHKEYNAAMRGSSEYESVFYPWFNDPEYTSSYITDSNRSLYSIRSLDDLDDEEVTLMRRHQVSIDRLIWRRWHIANKCGGDVEKFHQEMPTTVHEAFISTGRNVFYLPNLMKHYYPRRGHTGKLTKVNGRVEFQPDPRGYLTLYALPSDDDWGVYLLGGDPTHSTQGDFACIQIINRRTLEQVGVYRRKIDPITFGKDMQRVGYFFNTAIIAPEKEGPGFATVGCIVADNYPAVFQMTNVTKMQGKPLDVAGWTTNQNTKELAIARLVKLFSEKVVESKLGDGSLQTFGLVIHDEVTLMELRDYVTSAKGLGYENADGSEYDDGVMALAIACAAHTMEPPPEAYSAAPIVGSRPRTRIVSDQSQAGIHDGTPHDIPLLSDDDEDVNRAQPLWETWKIPGEQKDYLS